MLSNKPLLVGITGGIGAGKSIVCRVFKSLGTPVYDADTRAKWLMNQSAELKTKIIQLFGEKAYSSEGILDNKFIAGEVFHAKEKLKTLNSFVHPAVKQDFEHWVEKHQNEKYVLKEAALLIEAGSYKDLDQLILVTAPKEIRIKRVLERDLHRDRNQVLAIIDKQLADNLKAEKAHHVLVNDGETMLLPQILGLHQTFNNRS